MDSISHLLAHAQEGDTEAEALLIARYEPMINKYAKNVDGFIDQDCKQQLTIAFIMAVRRFDLTRYQ